MGSTFTNLFHAINAFHEVRKIGKLIQLNDKKVSGGTKKSFVDVIHIHIL